MYIIVVLGVGSCREEGDRGATRRLVDPRISCSQQSLRPAQPGQLTILPRAAEYHYTSQREEPNSDCTIPLHHLHCRSHDTLHTAPMLPVNPSNPRALCSVLLSMLGRMSHPPLYKAKKAA